MWKRYNCEKTKIQNCPSRWARNGMFSIVWTGSINFSTRFKWNYIYHWYNSLSGVRRMIFLCKFMSVFLFIFFVWIRVVIHEKLNLYKTGEYWHNIHCGWQFSVNISSTYPNHIVFCLIFYFVVSRTMGRFFFITNFGIEKFIHSLFHFFLIRCQSSVAQVQHTFFWFQERKPWDYCIQNRWDRFYMQKFGGCIIENQNEEKRMRDIKVNKKGSVAKS